jgi:nuclear transcription Y subunit beta
LLPQLWRRRYSELCIDRWDKTLLANQNTKPAPQYNAVGPNAGANPAAENAQHPVLSGDTEMGNDDNTAFGYTVGHANGAAEF